MAFFSSEASACIEILIKPKLHTTQEEIKKAGQLLSHPALKPYLT